MPGWRSRTATRSGRRGWKARPRACAGGSACWPGRTAAVEAELVAQVRQRRAAAQFDQAFSAGSRLTQQEAVAIVRHQRGSGTQTP